jgi:predicted dehydrogenase
MLRAAIIGCGKIADAHVGQIQRIPGARLVAVCDAELLMAAQLARRAAVELHFDDVATMLAQARPDVVHVTTPPQSHFPLAIQCMDAGCHVYVEKPFTVTVGEAERLLARAAAGGLRVTVGHDDQFTHATRRMRDLVATGYLGERVVHMESHYCYELSGTYARTLLGDREHWVRRLPGQLLHNVISHGVCRICEFLQGERPEVQVDAFTSAGLRRLGESALRDELRAVIRDAHGTTAYFTFSSQMRPSLHQFRIYGTRNGLVVDHDQQTLVRLAGRRRTSYLERFVSPLDLAAQYAGNARRNVATFLRRDFHMKSGMKYLIEAFYRSIVEGTPVPIPYREILLTTRVMDAMFVQLEARRSEEREPALE